jgi:hypothetical protein
MTQTAKHLVFTPSAMVDDGHLELGLITAGRQTCPKENQPARSRRDDVYTTHLKERSSKTTPKA